MVIGVHGGLGAHGAAREFDGAVGDDLVGVHVRLRARAGLEDDQREVVVELAGDDLVAGLRDVVRDVGGQLAQLGVAAGVDLGMDGHARIVLVGDIDLHVVGRQAVVRLHHVLHRGLDGVLRDGDAAVVALDLKLRVLARRGERADEHHQQAYCRDA